MKNDAVLETSNTEMVTISRAEYEELKAQIIDFIDQKYVKTRLNLSQTEMLFLLHYDLLKDDPAQRNSSKSMG